jgi:class 3 adenylate cyclase
VLVVDDDPAVCEAVRRVLAADGYGVHTVLDGQAALDLLRAEPIGLVISDKDMPGMSGLELLDLVRDRHPRVCRIMLTGKADLPSAIEAINASEVHRFIEKPWSNEHLLTTIAFAFETIELEEEIRRQTRELERERRRSELLLLNVLPGPIAERLKRGETVIADRYERTSVLFSDLVGFTAQASALSPQALVELLDTVISAFDDVAAAYGVEKIKTIGDGFLAVAGVPVPRDDHASAIADVALGMETALEAVNRRMGLDLRMRIGLHCGPLVAGVIGRSKFTYDVWGDTVNVASRMQSLGEPGRIHVSADFRGAAGPGFRFEPRGIVEVKGKGPCETAFLLGRSLVSRPPPP